MAPPQEWLDTVSEVEATKGAMASAVVVIDGIGEKIQAAIDAHIAANPGVDVSEFVALKDGLAASRTDLSRAVAANP